MAGSSEDPRRICRRLADPYGGEPEEGELVPAAGYHSDADTEEYYNTNAACSSDSDETISDSAPANGRAPAAARNKGGASTASSAAPNSHGGGGASSSAAPNNNGGASSYAAAPVLACPFCGKEFRNHKALCGHMKVHRDQGSGIKVSKGAKRNAAAGVGGWGGTGKQGCSGSRSRAASPDPEPDQSTAVVVAEPKIVFNPMPLAFAAPNPLMASATPKKSSSSSVPVASVMTSDSVESSSAQPKRDDAMDTVVEEAAANPPAEAAVNLHAAPPAAPPPAAGEQDPPVPQQQPLAPPPPGGRQDPKGYTCKRCGMWFRTRQGLGGHIVGHKNRELAVAAALHAGDTRNGGRDAKAGKAHACKVCGKEFAGGLQLGGHMRKHWPGPPFNKKPRIAVPPLALAQSVRADAAAPAPRPAVAGRVLLFGIDIGAGVKTPPAEQGSPATEQTAASTGGEQQ